MGAVICFEIIILDILVETVSLN